MTTKDFDCIEMKREGALKIHERLKDMTLDEKIAHWQRRSADFRREQEEILSHRPAPSESLLAAKQRDE